MPFVSLTFLLIYYVFGNHVDGTATVTPKVQIVAAGQPAVFNCSVSEGGNPSDDVQWSMIGGTHSNPVRLVYRSSYSFVTHSRYFVDTSTPGMHNLIINVTQITDVGSYYCTDDAFQTSTNQQTGQLLVLEEFTVTQNSNNPSDVTQKESKLTICKVLVCKNTTLQKCLVDSVLNVVVTLSVIDERNRQLTVVNSSSLNSTSLEIQHNSVPSSCVMPAYECSVTATTVQGNSKTIAKYTNEICPVRNLITTPTGNFLSMNVDEYLTCSAEGSSIISYQWSDTTSSNRASPLNSGPILFLTSAGVFHYQCIASNMVQNITYYISSDLICVTVTEKKVNIIIGVCVGLASVIILSIILLIVCIKGKRSKIHATEVKYEVVTPEDFVSSHSSSKKAKQLNSDTGSGSSKKGVNALEDLAVYADIPDSGRDSNARGKPVIDKTNEFYHRIESNENKTETRLNENNNMSITTSKKNVRSAEHGGRPIVSPTPPFYITVIEDTDSSYSMTPAPILSPSATHPLKLENEDPKARSFGSLQNRGRKPAVPSKVQQHYTSLSGHPNVAEEAEYSMLTK